MNVQKSYTLGDAELKQVEQQVAEGKSKFESIAHIVCESQIDAGVFFAHDLEEDRDELK